MARQDGSYRIQDTLHFLSSSNDLELLPVGTWQTTITGLKEVNSKSV